MLSRSWCEEVETTAILAELISAESKSINYALFNQIFGVGFQSSPTSNPIRKPTRIKLKKKKKNSRRNENISRRNEIFFSNKREYFSKERDFFSKEWEYFSKERDFFSRTNENISFFFRSNTNTHREQFRCISLYVYSKRRVYKEPEFARTKIHQKLKQKHAFYLENTKIVHSVWTEVLSVLDSKKT